MVHSLKSIVFDFDYTIADSSRGIIDCTNYALAQMSLPVAADDLVCRTIGLPLDEAFSMFTEDAPTSQVDRFIQLFNERADKTMVSLTVLLDSVPEVIKSLKDQNVSLGVVSNKYHRRIRSVLKREGLLEGFDVIIGGDEVVKHKPHPEGLLRALRELQVDSSNAIYVGDAVVDALFAEQANVEFIAVLSGVTGRDAFSNCTVSGIIESINDLPHALVDRLFVTH